MPTPKLSRPHRSTNDRTSQATLHDGAQGRYRYAPAAWLRETGLSPHDAQEVWAEDKLLEVPTGSAWDVIRLPLAEGWQTVQHLRGLGLPIGPIMAAYDAIEVLVPVGAANGWDLPDTGVLTTGRTIELPHPLVVAPHTCRAKTWIIPPHEIGALTDVADLYGAYAAARRSVRSPQGDGR